jgi:hypothetical protein
MQFYLYLHIIFYKKILAMKTPIEVPMDLILFIVGIGCLYGGIREIKKHKERKRNAPKFNDFGFIEDKWGYIDYRGYNNIYTFFLFSIPCLLVVLYHLLEKL